MWVLSEADLYKVMGGSNGNPDPGYGTETAIETHNFQNTNGYPGSPQHSSPNHDVGTSNAYSQTDQYVGIGRNTR